MSVTPVGANPVPHRSRRVRHQAREQVLLMAFSAATSVLLAAMLLILTTFARQV